MRAHFFLYAILNALSTYIVLSSTHHIYYFKDVHPIQRIMNAMNYVSMLNLFQFKTLIITIYFTDIFRIQTDPSRGIKCYRLLYIGSNRSHKLLVSMYRSLPVQSCITTYMYTFNSCSFMSRFLRVVFYQFKIALTHTCTHSFHVHLNARAFSTF
jgi:hypothetical protein